MKTETKNCQNCKKDFTIESEDFNFYEKIKVPPPTFCSECRMIRRLIWRNMRSLNKRECGLCHKSLISIYSDDGCPVYCIECFNGDNWDQFANAQDIDWSRNFLLQIYEIFQKQPRVYQIRLGTVVNSDYGSSVVNSKNSYMCFSSINNEDVMYSENIDKSRNSIDCFYVQEIDQCSWNILSSKNYDSHFLVSSTSCISSYFLYDCMNCQNCCLSSNLRNQQYIFCNQKLSKNAYHKAVADLHLETYLGFEKTREEFDEIYKNSIHKYAQIIASHNATGDFIFNSKNVLQSFDVTDSSENIFYSNRIIKSKELFDCSISLQGELAYECLASSGNTFSQLFSIYSIGSKYMQYTLFCRNCSDCFGCVGLKNAQYCILNKQYSKEEYFELLPKIIEHMKTVPYIDEKGRVYSYGEFFPFKFSPSSYNETVILDYFPISKDRALEMGYPWKDKARKEYPEALMSADLPDSIDTVNDAILNQVIACPNNGNQEYQCTSAFKIILDELQFYRQKSLPIPRYCPNCRHYQRLKYRNPMKLWHRSCMCGKENHFHGEENCDVGFETSYAPERSEIVYCEKCYQQEVY